MKKDLLGCWKNILYICIASGVIITGSAGAIWAFFMAPAVRIEIDKKMSPVVNAVQYNSFILMEMLDSAQVTRANSRYTAWKSGAGGLSNK